MSSAAAASGTRSRPTEMDVAPGTPVPVPGPTLPPQVIAISPNDLQNLLNAAVQNAVRQNTEQRRNGEAPNSKGLKLADQKEYSGRPEDLNDFLNNCEMVFALKSDVYNQNDKKIGYALSLMKDKTAELWKRQYIQSNFARGAFTDTWNLFKDKLMASFKDVGQAQNAMKALQTLKQGNMAIEEFNTKFLIHGGKAGFDFGDTMAITRGQQVIEIDNPHNATLVHMYQNAVSPKIAQQIIVNGEPPTIGLWMSRAAEIDSAYRRTNATYGRGVQGYGKSTWKPQLQRREYRGEPMDIGYMGRPDQYLRNRPQEPRLSKEEEERRKKNNLCFKCGKRRTWISESATHPGILDPLKQLEHRHKEELRSQRRRNKRRSSTRRNCVNTSEPS